jgi:hypothetical protein
MILTIFFAFILLIGISLFVAVVGTAFLRRHSTRVTRARGVTVGRSDFNTRFRKEFEQRVGGGADLETQRGPAYVPAIEREFVYRKPKEAGGEGKWFLITILFLVVVIFSFYFGIRGYQNLTMKPKLFFCENVDFVKLKPINKSDTFTRGNVTIFLKSRKPLETDTALINIYRIDSQGLNFYVSRELPVKPEWTSFSFKALFEEVGTYSVMVYGPGDQLLTQENISIVPDYYAYKPVRK